MKSSFKLQSIEAEEGLRSLRRDADKTARWLKEVIIKKKLEGGKRPKGIPPIITIDGMVYKFHSWYSNLVDAKEMCFAIKAGGLGHHCKIQRTVNGFYLVYKEKPHKEKPY